MLAPVTSLPIERRAEDTRADPRDLGPLGAFSIGTGGIVGGGIFATLGLAGSQARGATWLSFLVGAYVVIMALYAGAFASYVVMLLPESARDVSHPLIAPAAIAGLASSDQTFARLGPESWVSPLDIVGSGC
jgi:hypothetical protein